MSNFYSISIFCVLNRLFLCNHVKREWNWQPRHRPDRTFQVNINLTYYLLSFFSYLKSSSVLFFYSFSIYNFHVPFLRLFKRSLWLLHFSDYNWYGMGCDTMQSGAMFIYFTFNRLIRNTLFVIPVVTWKEHLNTHISICLMFSRFCGICKCNRAH